MRRVLGVFLAGILTVGCATTTPYVGQGPHPQVTRGVPFPPIDFLGNVLSLPFKLILWNWRFNNHAISEETEQVLTKYLENRNLPAFEHAVFRLNQYAPLADLRALAHNKHVAWPYRVLLGLPVTLITDVLLPGRLFPHGDYYNPFTNTAHLFSDDATIALHEAGHAYDFAEIPYKGTYAMVRLLPFVDLYQEYQATDEAIDYLLEIEDREMELRAYKTLYPAYGTYVGGYLYVPIGTIAGALIGHGIGRRKAIKRRTYYEKVDAALQPLEVKPKLGPGTN